MLRSPYSSALGFSWKSRKQCLPTKADAMPELSIDKGNPRNPMETLALCDGTSVNMDCPVCSTSDCFTLLEIDCATLFLTVRTIFQQQQKIH